ncbi:MAG: hypothetical protein HKO59_00355 [Phycisphaerales bacterium]|nr:hypothetical protein [Phycisphaerae bacterium]NNF42376.1 hypothetical protein [Phycisphaerales bacterium]NNM24432.1 hypothetical protein [Phycisphaerales bacterium]
MSGGRWRFVALVVACLTPAVMGLDQSQRGQVLAEGLAAYDQGVRTRRSDPVAARRAFDEAAARFQLLLDAGVETGWIHYNLANALLQRDDLGRAIAHYRRGLELEPGAARITHNLAHARSLRRNQIAPSGGRALRQAVLAWHHGTTRTTRLVVCIVAYTAFWLLLGVDRFRPDGRWRITAGIAAAIALLTGGSLAADAAGWGARPAGVVVVDDVVVRKGNGEGYEPQFQEPLHAGVELEIVEERGVWLQVELPDGKTGWLRSDQIARVGSQPAAMS